MTMGSETDDSKYLSFILDRIAVCKAYKPAFGQGQPVSREDFQHLYGADPFYGWLGLNHPLIYAAHSAAGGITSLYRQIGLGCEELFRQILQDCLALTETQVRWAYTTVTSDGQARQLSLDARIQLSEVTSVEKRARVHQWLYQAAAQLNVAPEIANAPKGLVFEVRQGYKSKDSKRQNADIANAATAYAQGYLPVLLILSTQIDSDVVERYRRAHWLILQGQLADSPFTSTYAFSKAILEYDLADFFVRNATILQSAIADVLRVLLQADSHDG